MRYIHLLKDWPNFHWDSAKLLQSVAKVRHAQGRLAGRLYGLGFSLQDEAQVETLAEEVVTSSAIEGEKLAMDEVRSSIARELGVELTGAVPTGRKVDAVVEMMMDVGQRYDSPLTETRLFGWNELLFPDGRSGMYDVLTGQWRDDSTGPMQVVSGALGKERVHFEAPSAKLLRKEMKRFMKWYDASDGLDLVLKAGIAHLYFVTIHPFEDGNGRLARALTDMMLSRSEHSPRRYYSMSAQIRAERATYYKMLEKTQKGSMDITAWLQWFLDCLHRAILNSEHLVQKVMDKHSFWQTHRTTVMNARQVKIVNRLMAGFVGNLTSSKWAKMGKCSADTALRDINDLVKKGVLRKGESGGRSTWYEVRKI